MYCVTQGVDRNGPSVYISIYDVVEYCLSEMLHQIYLERVMFLIFVKVSATFTNQLMNNHTTKMTEKLPFNQW